jgi:hypothetical protein
MFRELKLSPYSLRKGAVTLLIFVGLSGAVLSRFELVSKTDSLSNLSDQGWRYSFEKPSEAWMSLDFEDGSWKEGLMPFGQQYSGVRSPKTKWNTPSIYLRKSFQLDKLPKSDLYLEYFHDEDIQVFLNGTQILKRKGYSTKNLKFKLSPEQKKMLILGKNILAVYCINNVRGPGLIDVKLLEANP